MFHVCAPFAASPHVSSAAPCAACSGVGGENASSLSCRPPENRKPAAPFVCCRFRAALRRSNPCTMTSSSALRFFFLFWGNFLLSSLLFLPEIISLRFSISFAKEPCLFYTTKTVGSSTTRRSRSPAVISRRTRAIRTSNSFQSYFF